MSKIITRAVTARFSLGEVFNMEGEVETPSSNTGYVTYEIEGVEGGIEINGPLANQIAAQIVDRLNTPSSEGKRQKSDRKFLLRALREADIYIVQLGVPQGWGREVLQLLAAAIAKLETAPPYIDSAAPSDGDADK
jgi:hypothetical protein